MKEPNWLTDKLKARFDCKVVLDDGFRVTVLKPKHRGHDHATVS